MILDSAAQDGDDLLAKADALLKKHNDALARGFVAEDFPLLTEVVEAEEDFFIPVLTEVFEAEAVPPGAPDAGQSPRMEGLPLQDGAMAQLDSRIRAAIEERLPFHIVEAVDRALPIVLEEFALQLETLVRDAVALELQKQLKSLRKQGAHGELAE